MKKAKRFGLEFKSFPKHKQWALDQDYIHLLDDEAKDWLNQFNQEYYRNRIKKGDPNALHNTDELRKDCYNRENAANRDLYAIKATGNLIVGDCTVKDAEGNEESLLNMIPDATLMPVNKIYKK